MFRYDDNDYLLNRQTERLLKRRQSRKEVRNEKVMDLMNDKAKMLDSDVFKGAGRKERDRISAECGSLPLDLWLKE